MTVVYNHFVLHLRPGDVVYQRPSYSSPVSGINEIILRTGVEGIFPVHKLGMQHHIALLARCFQVGQPFPVHQVACTYDSRLCHRCRQVARRCSAVMAFAAKDAINPSVLMGGETHVVHIGFRRIHVGQCQRTFPEAEIVHPVRAFGYGKERLPVRSLHAHHHQIFSVPFHGTAVHGGIEADALHAIRVGGGIEVVTPLQGNMCSGQYGMDITADDPVCLFLHFVRTLQQRFLALAQCFYLLFEIFVHILFSFHCYQSIFYSKNNAIQAPRIILFYQKTIIFYTILLLVIRIKRHTINPLVNCIFQFQFKHNLLRFRIYFCYSCTISTITKYIAHARTN